MWVISRKNWRAYAKAVEYRVQRYQMKILHRRSSGFPPILLRLLEDVPSVVKYIPNARFGTHCADFACTLARYSACMYSLDLSISVYFHFRSHRQENTKKSPTISSWAVGVGSRTALGGLGVSWIGVTWSETSIIALPIPTPAHL